MAHCSRTGSRLLRADKWEFTGSSPPCLSDRQNVAAPWTAVRPASRCEGGCSQAGHARVCRTSRGHIPERVLKRLPAPPKQCRDRRGQSTGQVAQQPWPGGGGPVAQASTCRLAAAARHPPGVSFRVSISAPGRTSRVSPPTRRKSTRSCRSSSTWDEIRERGSRSGEPGRGGLEPGPATRLRRTRERTQDGTWSVGPAPPPPRGAHPGPLQASGLPLGGLLGDSPLPGASSGSEACDRGRGKTLPPVFQDLTVRPCWKRALQV